MQNFDSEGDFTYVSPQDSEDGYDAIEWLAEQHWCNGSESSQVLRRWLTDTFYRKGVALVANSWLAISQYYIAATKPRHLKCIAPWEGAADQYRETICRGGIPWAGFFEQVMNQQPGRGRMEDLRAELEK